MIPRRQNISLAAIPVASATTLAGYRPVASLADTPDPNQADVLRLTRLIDALNAMIAKGLAQGWPSSSMASLRKQKADAVAQRDAIYRGQSAQEKPSAFMLTLSDFSDWATRIIGKAGEGIADLPGGVAKSLPLVAMGLGAVALVLLGKKGGSK